MIDKCYICGGEAVHKCDVPFGELVTLKEIGTRSIGLCPNCGYIYIMNPISLEITNSFYATAEKFFTSTQSATAHKNRARRQMRFILDATGTIKTVFEFGALGGDNLVLYKQMGMNVCGTDLSLHNIEFANSQHGIKLYRADLDEYCDGNKEKFDLILLSQVLEHIIDPCSAVKKISSINSKYIFIEVPSFDYKYIDMPYGIFIPTHHSYFTLESLKNLMKVAGYRLLNAELLLGGGKRPNSISCSSIQTVWEKRNIADAEWDSSFSKSTISSEQYLDTYIEQSEKLIKEIAGIIDRIPDDLRLAV